MAELFQPLCVKLSCHIALGQIAIYQTRSNLASKVPVILQENEIVRLNGRTCLEIFKSDRCHDKTELNTIVRLC